MAAFFVATATIKDAEKYQQYGAGAGPTIIAHGGELVIRGKVDKALAGSAGHQTVAVARFPSMEALEGWYQSNAYQALIPLRDAAVDMNLVSYSEPA